jgi:hypothetical protein
MFQLRSTSTTTDTSWMHATNKKEKNKINDAPKLAKWQEPLLQYSITQLKYSAYRKRP